MENYISANPTEKYIAQNDTGLEELKNSGKLDFGEKVYVIESGETKIMGNDGNIYDFHTPSSSVSPTPTPTPVDDGYVLVATQQFTAYDAEHPEINEQENEDFVSAIAENMPIDTEAFRDWCDQIYSSSDAFGFGFIYPGLVKIVVEGNGAVYNYCGDAMDNVLIYSFDTDIETGELAGLNIHFDGYSSIGQCDLFLHMVYDAETGDSYFDVVVNTPIQSPVDTTVSFYMKSSYREV